MNYTVQNVPLKLWGWAEMEIPGADSKDTHFPFGEWIGRQVGDGAFLQLQEVVRDAAQGRTSNRPTRSRLSQRDLDPLRMRDSTISRNLP